jgi:hypothetical protein
VVLNGGAAAYDELALDQNIAQGLLGVTTGELTKLIREVSRSISTMYLLAPEQCRTSSALARARRHAPQYCGWNGRMFGQSLDKYWLVLVTV